MDEVGHDQVEREFAALFSFQIALDDAVREVNFALMRGWCPWGSGFGRSGLVVQAAVAGVTGSIARDLEEGEGQALVYLHRYMGGRA